MDLASVMPLAANLLDYSSLCILVILNAYLATDNHLSCHQISPIALANVLCNHLTTTLLQITSCAIDNFGFVNLTRNPQLRPQRYHPLFHIEHNGDGKPLSIVSLR
ncbi:hypothetical protein HKD37_20G056996 [Glycine soja]